ncbi:hypothetical protein DRJ16_00030 [Candidatus Woesearchaeota archaeon]|nr:MAG: hypothetical protein DRJ16_00030 [Candidatus Woesearchaeota archaeon]
MRFYNIALFLFILQTFGALFIAYASDMGMEETLIVRQPTQEEIQEIEQTRQTIQNTTSSTVTSENPLSAALGWFYQQITTGINSLFASSFMKYVIWIPLYLQAIGVPPAFAWGVFSVYTVIEFVGLIQLITGRWIE